MEDKHYARNRAQRADSLNYGITYGNPRVPKNCPRLTSRAAPLRGGDGAIVVSYDSHNQRMAVTELPVRTITSKAGSDALRGSEAMNTQESQSINIKNISNIKNLVAAYELIKSNPGNMTKGMDDITLDGINLSYFKDLQTSLKAGKFDFSPARRVRIPKPGKNETRPLTMASPREKIVQKAILMIMERFYESKFLNSSHGFRPARGTHTAMKLLESSFQSGVFIIEADFSKAFDTIQHKTLMSIIRDDVKCEKTLRLIKSSLKAGFIEFGELHNNLSVGTSQGSILSPLLCNIYLHRLDEYIEKLKMEHQRGTKRQKSLEYMSIQNKAKY
jgi:retron-type reverse transcriptase